MKNKIILATLLVVVVTSLIANIMQSSKVTELSNSLKATQVELAGSKSAVEQLEIQNKTYKALAEHQAVQMMNVKYPKK